MLEQIKKRLTNKVIFELDKENNTIRDTVEEAVRRGISLSRADFSCATLKGADLHGAKLYNASFANANLEGANIEDAQLDNTILDNTIMPDFPIACPETGTFIGYKKVFCTEEYGFKRSFIVKLEIPEDAKRSSSTTNKCRCSKAKVLEVKDMELDEKVRKITNINMFTCVYEVGEYVYPDSFDECRWNECSNGIHFFMTEEEAASY